jgi:hypothetical protein
MDELSRLQREIHDLVNLLSFISKSAPDFEERSTDTKPSHHEDLDPDPNVPDELHEAEIEAPDGRHNADADTLKRVALDRLAEILARFKTPKGTKKRNKRNSDAKHVTSVLMLEDMEDKSATFLCAKNEGLDRDDMDFLGRLESLLRIPANGKQNSFLSLRVASTNELWANG